ncbi:MAG: BlaI/MecI/CopY family transcriptional regulator [Planctomycetota bacterium]|jgi:predicted transcriptional regulator
MPRKAARVTETEWAIMDVLWKGGPISVREIVESLYSEHTPSLHATVKSLLDRLTEKGCVACDASRFAHRFSASIDRDTLVGEQLQQIADSHFGGSLTPMLLSLVSRAKLSREDREAIRRLIDRIEPPPESSS